MPQDGWSNSNETRPICIKNCNTSVLPVYDFKYNYASIPNNEDIIDCKTK